MKQNKIINAKKIIDTLNKTQLSSFVAFRVFKLKKKLDECFEWQEERERELFEEYGASFNEDGSITLADMDKAEEFVSKITEMSELEQDIEPVEIPLAAFETLSIEQIEALDGIINFVE